MPASERARLQDELESIVRKAGELARITSRGPFKRWTKGNDNSPVSEGDIAVNNFLREHLNGLLPDAGWLSEETEDHLPGRIMRQAWIVDPIDGTRAYISGRADWTVSVALVEDGRPELVALYAPVSEEMFLATRTQGATLNGRPIRVKGGGILAGAKLAGPRRYLERLEKLDPAVLSQPKVHSLALRLTRVAHGELDIAFASGGSHDWDLAAADLLVHEAGGVMTDFTGQPLSFNRPHVVHGPLIAASPTLHSTLIAMMRDRAAEFA